MATYIPAHFYRYFFSQKVVYLNGVYCGMCINIFNSNNWPPLCNDLTFRHQTKHLKTSPTMNSLLFGVETLLYAPTLYLLFLYFKTKLTMSFKYFNLLFLF